MSMCDSARAAAKAEMRRYFTLSLDERTLLDQRDILPDVPGLAGFIEVLCEALEKRSHNIYTITVCPDCAAPIRFPDDDQEGMRVRTRCANGHLVIEGDEKNIEVVPV